VAAVNALAVELAELARNLRQAGDEGLRRELVSGIKDAADPIPGEIRRQLPDFLPDRYAEVLNADMQISVSVRTGGTGQGVSVVAPERMRGKAQRRRITRLNAGILAHPLFGDRERWFSQTDGVTRGFFDKPAEDSAPRVRAEIEKALDRVKDEIYKGIHG